MNDGHFFDVMMHDSGDDSLSISYESRWTHNFCDVAAICKEYNLTAYAEFDENGCDYHGSCDYSNDGTYKESFISEYFFREVEYNYETDMYEYREGEWENVNDLIDDEYLSWVKELLTDSDDNDIDTIMQISGSWIEAAVGQHESADAVVQLLLSMDVQNVKLGTVLYKSIIKSN
jgi:hypothetical protein